MIQKIKKNIAYLILFSCFVHGQLAAAHERRSLSGLLQARDKILDDTDYDEQSIWDAEPVEIDSAQVQILDKISGNIFRKKIKICEIVAIGSIRLQVKRIFKNNPEDNKELAAFVQVYENDEMIFAKWLFASAASINLFQHPIYDIKVEFSQ